MIQLSSIIRENNQKWNGGNPIFQSRLTIIVIWKNVFLFNNIKNSMEANKKMEPMDWIKKYFILVM